MRLPLLAATFLALSAVPAAAQDADVIDDGADIEAMADKLSDPAMQAKAALMARGVMGMLLELPVGPLARAAAEMKGDDPDFVDPDMTLRDLGGEDVNDLPQNVQSEVPRMMDRLAGMSGAFGAMLPALRDMAERLQETVDTAAFE